MAAVGEIAEREGIERARAGSRAAFAALVQPHTRRLIVLATRMLRSSAQAEDAVQDSLASLWLTRQRLDSAKPIGPYLTTIVLNRCRDRLRKRKLAGFFGLSGSREVPDIADDAPTPETRVEARERLRLVEAEIDRLPLRLREALILVSIEGHSQAEAAQLLGTSEKAIETRIYRARGRLRERLEIFEG